MTSVTEGARGGLPVHKRSFLSYPKRMSLRGWSGGKSIPASGETMYRGMKLHKSFACLEHWSAVGTEPYRKVRQV